MSVLLSLLCDPFFVVLVFFEVPHFQWQLQSGAWRAPELKSWVYKTLLCLGDTWTVLSSGKCSQSLHKPHTRSCGTPRVSHLPTNTQPIELEGAELEPAEEGEHRSQLPPGASSPEVFTLFSHTSTLKVPYCELGMSLAVTAVVSHGLPGAVCEGIPWHFSWTSWCRVRDVPDVSPKRHLRCQQPF